MRRCAHQTPEAARPIRHSGRALPFVPRSPSYCESPRSSRAGWRRCYCGTLPLVRSRSPLPQSQWSKGFPRPAVLLAPRTPHRLPEAHSSGKKHRKTSYRSRARRSLRPRLLRGLGALRAQGLCVPEQTPHPRRDRHIPRAKRYPTLPEFPRRRCSQRCVLLAVPRRSAFRRIPRKTLHGYTIRRFRPL